MSRILIIEDEESIAALEKDYLELSDFEVDIETDGRKGLKKALTEEYDLYILDLMLPGTDGCEICSEIREIKEVPILMVTARSDDIDKIRGLGLGADDYLEKPYDIDILLAKIKGIFKRRFAEDKLTEGDITLDLASGKVSKNGKVLDMTAKEFELLKLLIENKGQTLTKGRLFNAVWGMDSESEQQTLTVHIKWLREKIENDPKNPVHIITVWGKGYRWEG